MDKRPTGIRIRCKGEPSTGRINLRLETIGQKTGEREGVKQITARPARRRAHADELQHGIRLCAFRGATARRSALQHPSYSHATARHARRSAHPEELQHGAVPRPMIPYLQHGAHGARGAGRTPGSYSTTGCASVKGRCARKTEHSRAQSN